MISDTPGQGGRGVKKGQIFADVLCGWPLSNLFLWHKLLELMQVVLFKVNNPGHILSAVTMVSIYVYEIALHVCSHIPLQSCH